MASETWEERMAQRAADRRRNSLTDPTDAEHRAHGWLLLGTGVYCGCGEHQGVTTVALTGSAEETIHWAACQGWLDAVREHGHGQLNPLIDGAVQAATAEAHARIAELERQKDAVMALCDEADRGQPEAIFRSGPEWASHIRAIYGGGE